MNTHIDQHASDMPWPRPEPVLAPSQDLLDRAHSGWQRFLDSFEEPAHE
ncbi:hypothetical protein [Streptomyces sp. C]|nr:hypothetical protein [Streptomyces sp. C]